MATVYPTNQIQVLRNRKVFFDANVLIYLFWPSGSLHWENRYSSIFKNLLRQQNELLVDFIVISEFINRAIRLELNKAKSALSYKNFRNSADGQAVMSDIYLIVETNILNKFTVVGKKFTQTEIHSLLIVDTLDFADKGILLTCKEKGCVLLTNDADFKNADIDILTANPIL